MTPDQQGSPPRGDRRARCSHPSGLQPLAHFTTDLWGRIEDANLAAQALLAEDLEGLRGRRLGEFQSQATREGFAAQVCQLQHQRGAAIGSWTGRVRDRQGREIPVSLSAVRGGEGGNGEARLLWVLRDESELVRVRNQLRDVSVELLFAEERQRAQLSEDLHDDLGQLLALLALKLAKLRDRFDASLGGPLEEIEHLVDQIARRTTSLTFQLHPPMLQSEGLVPAAEWLAHELRHSYGLEVKLESSGDLTSGIDLAARILLFRSLRELLVNVAKHADANHAHARIAREGDSLALCVRDDGRGPGRAEIRDGYGLRSIRERCEGLGGAFTLERDATGGTRATIVLPIAGPDPLENRAT